MNIPSIEMILKSMTILYVEPNEKFKVNVTNGLAIKCKKVFNASSYDDALELYKTHKPDIIITEVILNGGNGLDFVSEIRKYDQNIPIIIITSSTLQHHLLSAIKLNLIDYIVKPIEIKQLRIALNTSVKTIVKSEYYEIQFPHGIGYNMKKGVLTLNGENLNITNLEVLLLNILILNQHYVLSKEEIKEMVWKDSFDVSDVAFKTLLGRLRAKIGKNSIKNISGRGYVLNINNE